MLVQPVMMVLALRRRPSRTSRANVPVGACSTGATPRVAPARRGDRRRPATSCRRGRSRATSEARAPAARGATLARRRRAGRLRARRRARPGPQVQLLLDGSDPLTAARVGGVRQRGRGQLRCARRRRATSGRRARRPAPIDVRQRFWFNPTLADREFFLSALAGMLLTNLCLSATGLGARRRARERHLRADAGAADDARSRSCSGSSLPYVVLSYAVLLLSHDPRRARLRLLAAGQLARAPGRHPAVRARLARHRRAGLGARAHARRRRCS